VNEIRELVRKTYQNEINNGPYPEEFKRALKTHERIPVFFNNLVREMSKPGLNPSRETIIMAARDLTKIFVAAVHKQAEERVMSPIRQAMMKADQTRVAEMKKLGDAFDQQGEEHEQVTQDKKGTTSRAVINADKIAKL
jgi:hypothetical protein